MKASEIDSLDSSRFQTFESVHLAKDYFLANCPITGWQYRDYVAQKKNRIKISITLAISPDHQAISLPYAPFGGFWCEKGLSSGYLADFIDFVIESLKSNGIKSITLTQAPQAYDSQSDLVNSLLFKSGWNLTNVLSHQFYCGAKPIKKFIQTEGPRIRKKMNTVGFQCSHGPISSFDFLNKIRTWNTSKGYEFAIQEDMLIKQVSSFPDRYFLITLHKNEQVIGYSLAVRLTSNSIYYFLSALDSSKESTGGGDFMMLELFLLGLEQEVDFIDLGSSVTGDQVNHSLMFFKARFSNKIFTKMTWFKKF